MSETFLNSAELFILSERKRKSAQRRALEDMNIPYVASRSGRPLVLRKYLYPDNKGNMSTEPNWN